VIAKIETGERPPSPDVASALLELFPDLGKFGELSEIAREQHGTVPDWFAGWVEIERVASVIRWWEPIIVPGLLQTADYARSLLIAAQTDASADVIDALVTARLARRAIFDRPEPPDVVMVLDESVLRREIGSREIMHDQLTELAALAERPFITVQIVPVDNGANAGLGGALNLASLDGAADVLHMDAVEGMTTERRALVRRAAVAFDHVRGDAYPKGQSHDLILRLADELWKI